jgi:molybdopterin-guanine dinucleotide biosynthesis protein A
LIRDVACLILAGGKSSRMGKDKALLPFGGSSSLTEFQLHKFEKEFSEVYISCKSRDKFNFDASFIEDDKSFKDSAPFIGIVSALKELDHEWIFVVSVDAPFFEISHFRTLFEAIDEKSLAIVSRSKNGDEPLCALYKKDTISIFEKLIKEKKYRFSNLFDNISLKFVDFLDNEAFTNLNTPEEYQITLKRMTND